MISRLFQSKHLNKEVKVLYYKTIIRPILISRLTYAFLVWFNFSCEKMEKLQKFKSNYLRACTRLNRDPDTNYKKYYTCECLYNAANIPRIDSLKIRLSRNYYANIQKIKNNKKIIKIINKNRKYQTETLKTGHIQPKTFIMLDDTKLLTKT